LHALRPAPQVNRTPASVIFTILANGASWINGKNPVLVSMHASLERLEKISTE
jgi:hypothetical protein